MGLVHDVRFALRVFARKPSFTFVVVATLALGIGAGSAMFSVLHALLVRPLDLPNLDRLAMIQSSVQGEAFANELTPRGFLDDRAEARSFSDVAAYQWWEVPLTGGGDPEEIVAFQVSPGFFDILGARPELGRWFAGDEVDGGNDKVAVLSHGLWERRYGRDPAILGKPVTIAGVDHTVVGVMPASFGFPSAGELWAPLTLTPEQRADRRSHYLGVIARLAPGVSLATADAEVRQLGERQAATYPDARGSSLRAVSLVRGVTQDGTRSFMMLVFGAALFVLLIACANVANLFLAHTLARRKELAVRAALGAGRARIVRQLLTEAALLGVAGGAASLFLASWAIDAVHHALPASIVRFVPGWDTMGVDPAVLVFALGIGLLVGLVFGVVPALQLSRTDVGAVLKEEGRGTTGGTRAQRLRSVLVAGQIALALVLLLGATALVQGFVRLAEPRSGIELDRALTFRVTLPEARYGDHAAVADFQARVLARLRALPGVDDAAAVTNVFWADHNRSRVLFPENRVVRPEDEIEIAYRPASTGYPGLLGVPVIAGRALGGRDDAAAPPVAVLSAEAARRLWPGPSASEALGRRFRFSRDENGPWVTVVGIVGDVPDGLERAARPVVYVPYAQEGPRGMTFVVRTGEPIALIHAAEAAVYAEDPTQPVTEVRTLRQVLAERMAGFRIGSALMAAFALLALAVAAVGIYGVIATLVAQRTHEIGIRMALGARRGAVVGLVLTKGAWVAGAGIAVGLAAGVAVVRLMSSLLLGIVDGGAATFAVATAAVAAIALIGSLVPAWRAARVDPVIALRHD